MNKRQSKIILVIVFLIFNFTCYADEIDIAYSGVDNIYHVAPGIYRSGQPSAKDMARLEALGLRSVLNLREWHTDDDEAEDTALKLYHVQMSAGSIDDDEIVRALRAVKDAPKPLLIHCWHGSDRTGAVVAMYRIIFEEWDKEVAIQELMQPQYGHHYRIYDNIAPYIRDADIEALKARIFE
ncbi:MAG: tyrosine-protein phosphatase [Deferribacteraceae bacterium]|jgi:protein tyrosine/serine phosphatase|nr:tyrosine-protein phosphatase [Deferribacteraceae bacterium]